MVSMRICLVVPGFSASSGEWTLPAVQCLASWLAQSHELTVISLRFPATGVYEFEGIVQHALGGGLQGGLQSVRLLAKAWQTVRALHRSRPFDLIHALWCDEPGAVAAIAGKRLGVPSVVSCAGGELVWLPELPYGTAGSAFRRWLVRFAMRGADRVTAGSRYLASLVARHLPAEATVTLAPLGLDCLRFAATPAPAPPLKLVQAASLMPVKNQVLLLEMMRHVVSRVPAAHLAIAGGGATTALTRLARQMGIDDRVRWHGAVPFPAMPGFYSQGHAYVQTSLHEAQGLAVLEALACGLTPLGTPVGILPEVTPLETTTDARQMADQVVDLWHSGVLTKPETRRHLHAQAARRFDLAVAGNRFQLLYQSLTNNAADSASDGPKKAAGTNRHGS
jgi:glycosyltransferase involved in cell wall biosynthesis